MTAPKKRIVIVSHYYPPHTGGIEMVAKNQAERLAALGHTVMVVTSGTSLKEPAGMINGVRVLRIPALNAFEKKGVPFPLTAPIMLISTLVSVIRKADVVHIHDAIYVPCFTAAIVARVLRKPVVLTQHVGIVPHKPLVIAMQKVMHSTAGAIVYKTSKVVCTLNDSVEQHVRDRGVKPENLKALANGVDTTLFRPASQYEKNAAREEFGLSHNKPVVLFVGRAVPKKGYDKVLAACSSDYQLVFAGGEPSTGDEPHVVHLGKLSQNKLARVYRAADIFVLPSEGEGFPMSVQEAMASGLPVITTDDPGYARYKLNKKRMVMLKEPSAKSVRKAIVDLLADKERRADMALYSRSYAEEHFGWDTIVADLNNIYDNLLLRTRA
jgi:D-inositol-3-phosphate glycosyltransferase